jgi:hypothetical protein
VSPQTNVAQSLILLESEIFGKTYPQLAEMSRLTNLEQHVFGRAYPQMSFQQRISRLMLRSTYRQSALPDDMNMLLWQEEAETGP